MNIIVDEISKELILRLKQIGVIQTAKEGDSIIAKFQLLTKASESEDKVKSLLVTSLANFIKERVQSFESLAESMISKCASY